MSPTRQTAFSLFKKLAACAGLFAAAACSGQSHAQTETQAVAEKTAAKTIVVSGRGEARAEPDLAIITVGVETTAPAAADAIAQNNQRAAATIAALKKAAVAPRDIQTSALSLTTQYDYKNASRNGPRITGYTARNAVTVRLREVERAGAVLDAAIKAGANQLSRFALTLADPKPVMDEARRDAVLDAKRKAALYAKSAGVTLGPVIHISDAPAASYPGPQAAFARADVAESAAVPIEAGENVLSASVTVVFAIQ